MAVDPFPPMSEDLVEELDRRYPHRCIEREETPEEAHRYAGKRELIDRLMQWKAVDAAEFRIRRSDVLGT